MYAITEEHGQLISRMLWLKPGRHGWRLFGHTIATEQVQAHYRHRIGFQVTLSLVHPSVPALRGGQTHKFRIVPVSATRGIDPTPLVDQITRQVASLESEFAWRALDNRGDNHAEDRGDLHLDSESIALRAGLKPSLRLTSPRAEADQLAARLRHDRLHVQMMSEGVDFGAGERVVLCVSPDPARAVALCEAERTLALAATREPTADELSNMYLHIGTLLGYPRCCVAAFAGRATLDRSCRGTSSMPYHAACEAWVPRPYARLNNLRFGDGIQLISFEPCRYDCQVALQLADAIADAVAKTCRRSLESIDRILARPVAIAPSGERVEVELDGEANIIACTPIPRWQGRTPDPTLAHELGGTVDTQGWVADSGAEPVRVLDFRPRS